MLPKAEKTHLEDLVAGLQQSSKTKILFVIADGLGGLPSARGGTELELAHTPHLDRIASEGSTGMLTPVAPGITPGSGSGHLALFGYDPLRYNVGRGVLAALGIDFDLGPADIAARGNFCTVDDHGIITDRRAGRISSEHGQELVDKLQNVDVNGTKAFVRLVKEHRFLLVLRGEGLGEGVADTDPQQIGVPPREPRPADREDFAARKTVRAVSSFVEQARQLLGDEPQGNMVLLRGFERLPDMSSVEERYGLSACAVAGYPMYRGIARLLGMQRAECTPDLQSEIDALHAEWEHHDFFFLHYKETDRAGEDGDFDAKIRAIEELDRHMPRILDARPDVLVVTGDHSTPSQLAAHSFHPVPVLLKALTCRPDAVEHFGERACGLGGLGHMRTSDLMPLALAHAGRLRKYGA